jgi:hypothetical protein
MKSAVCISGRPYSLVECADSIKRCLIEPNNADVYVFAWHDPALEGTRYRHHPGFEGRVPYNGKEKILEIYKPKKYSIIPQIDFPTENYDSTYQPGDKYFIFSIQSMLYSINRCIYFALQEEYDAICRTRFDLFYRKPVKFDELDLNFMNIYDNCVHEPGCCNDHFAVSNAKNMKVYADLWPEIYKMYAEGTPWCNEVFLGRWLTKNNIQKRHIDVDYFQWK